MLATTAEHREFIASLLRALDCKIIMTGDEPEGQAVAREKWAPDGDGPSGDGWGTRGTNADYVKF